jgi:hypothetical protein
MVVFQHYIFSLFTLSSTSFSLLHVPLTHPGKQHQGSINIVRNTKILIEISNSKKKTQQLPVQSMKSQTPAISNTMEYGHKFTIYFFKK